jgi:hybrid cluster-associated redox disulfide protein
MNKKNALTPAITVKEVLDRHPQALQVFLDIGLLCVGCPAEAFHTLADVVREYHLDLNQLLQSIDKAIGDDAVSSGPSSQKSDDRGGF